MKKKIKMILAISLCCLGILGMATYAAVTVYSDEYQIALAKTVEENSDEVNLEDIIFNKP